MISICREHAKERQALAGPADGAALVCRRDARGVQAVPAERRGWRTRSEGHRLHKAVTGNSSICSGAPLISHFPRPTHVRTRLSRAAIRADVDERTSAPRLMWTALQNWYAHPAGRSARRWPRGGSSRCWAGRGGRRCGPERDLPRREPQIALAASPATYTIRSAGSTGGCSGRSRFTFSLNHRID